MSKKIVAIGGGENGRIKNGIKKPYELENIDKEIIKLTEKEFPNFLLIAHSQLLENQDNYFQVMIDIYKEKLGCPCKHLKSDKLNDKEYVRELIDWADIIFEAGGNTLDMIKLWKDTGFDKELRKAWESGKVMCGVSAGANCWFSKCSSDSLKIKYGDDQPLIGMECLGFIKALFVPHCNIEGRGENAKELLKINEEIGILVSNCCALEIIDDKYRIIKSVPNDKNFIPYALKCYWNNEEYIEEEIKIEDEFKSLEELLSKNITK